MDNTDVSSEPEIKVSRSLGETVFWFIRKSLIPMKLVVVLVTAWAPFFGYGYLKGKLEGAGFSEVYIEPSVYQVVMAFFEGIAPAMLSLLDQFEVFIYIATGASVLIASYIVYLVHSHSNSGQFSENDVKSRKDGIYSRLLSWYENNVREINKNGALNVKSLWFWTVTVFVLFFGQILIPLFLLLIVLYLWLIGVGGFVAGQKYGYDIISKDLCFERNDGSCVMVLMDEKEHEADRLYSDKVFDYYLTCDGVYQVSVSGKIKSYRYWKKNRCSRDSSQ
jgi:hypothetical protein